jgi:alpha-L-rhamnosidase
LSFGEVLQRNHFYRGNLRTARAVHKFIADGRPQIVRPHFTFFGFRFVRVKGIPDPKKNDFVASSIHSEMEQAGWIETSNFQLN